MEKPQLFISYNQNDAEIAKSLVDDLRQAGIEVWKAPESIKPSETWLPAIDKAIRDAFALAVILTADSIKSQWVTYEWTSASLLEKEIFPIIAENISDHSVHDKLRSKQFVYLNDQSTQSREMERFIEKLKQVENEYKPNSLRVPLNAPQIIRNAVLGLDSGDPYERQNSVKNLTQLNHPMAVDLLYLAAIEALYPDVRIMSVLNLHNRIDLTDDQEEKLIPVLLEALASEDESEKLHAHSILVNLGELGIPQLLQRWRNRYPIHLTDSIQKILLYISEPVLPFMAELYKVADLDTRKRIMWFLDELKSEDKYSLLIVALKDENAYIRYWATRLLGRKQFKVAVPSLIPLLTDTEVPEGMSRPISDWAMLALAEIATEEAFEAIAPEVIRSLSDMTVKIIDDHKVRRCDEVADLLNRKPELMTKPDIKIALEKYNQLKNI